MGQATKKRKEGKREINKPQGVMSLGLSKQNSRLEFRRFGLFQGRRHLQTSLRKRPY